MRRHIEKQQERINKYVCVCAIRVFCFLFTFIVLNCSIMFRPVDAHTHAANKTVDQEWNKMRGEDIKGRLRIRK